MRLEQLSQAKVAIWGYGVEGQASSEYLQLRCPELIITVLCPADEVAREESQKNNLNIPLKRVFNHQVVDAKLLSEFDVVIKSPGISPYQAAVTSASCQFISSTALWFSNERADNRAQVIAITGTKGKSTSCAMLAEVLESMGFEVFLAGNFGVPLIKCLQPCDYVVLETSSYQAQDGAIKADVAVLLNLYSEHLNWHGSEQQYHSDKWRLLQHAKKVVLNAKDPHSLDLLAAVPLTAEITYFEDLQGFYELRKVLMYQDKALLSEYGWQLKGAHNLRNAAAVCTVLTKLGLDIKSGMNALKKFQPLPHRLETVAVLNGVTYINDSIASTPHATWAAMGTVELSRTILLVGGYDRGVDWSWWVEKLVEQAPKMIVCSGENGKKIQQLILNSQIKTQCIWVTKLELAVEKAQQAAETGDTVLLSPGAPSFDAFDNYQHRGEQFIQWLNKS
jgi:UDP-N-acetylmuramoylalanine--D-glutamate ligase